MAVEAVKDEVKSPGELAIVVVTGLGKLGGDLDEVGVVPGRFNGPRPSLRGCSSVAWRVEPERLLLQREAVYYASWTE